MFDIQHEMHRQAIESDKSRGGIASLRPDLLRQEYSARKQEILRLEHLNQRPASNKLKLVRRRVKTQFAELRQWIKFIVFARREPAV
jgi:hypothetical protein